MGLSQFEVRQMIKKKDQRMMEAQRNQQLLERETTVITHHQKFDNSSKIIHCGFNRNQQQNKELLCSCNGLKCDGICRELHLHRSRFANPKPKKDVGVRKMWAEKCPEAYEKPGDYRT